MADQELRDKRGVDLVALVFGVAALLAAAYMLSDGAIWPGGFDLRWVFASGAVVIGLGLLAGSLLRQRR